MEKCKRFSTAYYCENTDQLFLHNFIASNEAYALRSSILINIDCEFVKQDILDINNFTIDDANSFSISAEFKVKAIEI